MTMLSQTGNRADLRSAGTGGAAGIGSRGFALLEVLMAVAILACGAGFLFRSFFITASAQRYAINRVVADGIMTEELWRAKSLIGHGEIADGFLQKGVSGTNPTFYYETRYTRLPAFAALYSIAFTIEWAEGQRAVRLKDSIYAGQRI